MKGSNRSKGNEHQVYQFLVDYTITNMFPPTVGEIRDGTTMHSTCTVYAILSRLEDQGLIKITRGTPRGIKLVGYKIVKSEERENDESL